MRPERVLFPLIRQVVARPRLADALFRFDSWGNPFCDEVYRDPYPMYDRVRADGPVVFRRMYNSWMVSGYEEARELVSSPDAGSAEQLELMREIPPYNKLSDSAMAFLDRMIVFADPPDHTRLRRLVNRAFTPRQVSRIEAAVTELAEQGVAAMLEASGSDRSPVDVAKRFATPLPINVICELLGVPEERWDYMRECSEALSRLGNPMEAFDPVEMTRMMDGMRSYFVELADERRANPRDDLISGLAALTDEEDGLDEDEYVAMVGLLMFAGHETTSGLLGNSIVALAAHPDQRELVRNNPDLWENAVEELLRWDTPVVGLGRTALRDFELAGHSIKKGQSFRIFFGAANHDPRKFDRADELHLDRDDPQSVSFGHGMHHCLGHALARMEARVALRAFVEGFGDYTIDLDASEWKRSATTRGPITLPVRPGPDNA